MIPRTTRLTRSEAESDHGASHRPHTDHRQDMDIAVPFYDRFLPLLGFDIHNRVSAVMKSTISSSSSTPIHDSPSLSRPRGMPFRGTRSIGGDRGHCTILPSRQTRAPRSIDSFVSSKRRSHDRERATALSGVWPGLLCCLLQGSGGHQVRDRVQFPRMPVRQWIAETIKEPWSRSRLSTRSYGRSSCSASRRFRFWRARRARGRGLARGHRVRRGGARADSHGSFALKVADTPMGVECRTT